MVVFFTFKLPHARNREFCGVGGVPTHPTNIMNPTEELADLHATLSAHTNCATDGRNWRLMWQRLCEQRQEAVRNSYDEGMRHGEALARIPTTVSEVEREEWRQEREKLKQAIEGWKASFGHENARVQEAHRTIDRLWATTERLVDNLTTYTQAFGESDQERPTEDGGDFTICAVCGQDIEETADHEAGCCYPKAKAALDEANELLGLRDARNREGGGGGGSENLPTALEKYNE